MTTELDFGTSAKLADGRRALLREANRVVDDIGYDGMEALKIRRQDVRDAINIREGRGLRTDWAWAMGLLAPEPMRAELARLLVLPLGYGVAPLVPLTDKEKLARLEDRVARRFGEAGAELVEENRR